MISFRPVTKEDAQLLFDWRNEKEARENSFSTAEILWPQHLEWFSKKLNDPNCKIFILENKAEKPIGQVRFDMDAGGIAMVSISIDPAFRSKGYGLAGLKLTCQQIAKQGVANKILAKVKKGNEVSYKLFTGAGFQKSAEVKIGTTDAWILELIHLADFPP